MEQARKENGFRIYANVLTRETQFDSLSDSLDRTVRHRGASGQNFYRRFIKGFSKLVRPTVNLTRKDQPFIWTDACRKAFELMKERVATAPVLQHFDRAKN